MARAKRAGHMPPKMRFLGAQMAAYLRDGLWLDLARRANASARRLADGLEVAGGKLAHPVDGNEVFCRLPAGAADRLSAAGAVWLWDDLSSSWYFDIFDDESASFRGVNIPLDAYVQYEVNGTDPVQESNYTATLVADANAGYEVSNVGPIFVGEIVRNGTQLQAPLVQTPNAWVSRIVLTNTGSSDRPYELSVMGESGNIIGVDSTLLVGTVPANGTKVIELDDILLTFSGSSRATINATIAAPNNQIQGLYQIVNPDSGSISNHVMVRPGSN